MRFENDAGTEPFNPLKAKSRYSSLLKLPSQDGIGPVNRLVLILKVASWVRFAKESGIRSKFIG